MAMDTREKRQSAVSLLVPSFTPGVDPSTIDAHERRAASWSYSGVQDFGGAPPPTHRRGLGRRR
jgi:hypothetical protein